MIAWRPRAGDAGYAQYDPALVVTSADKWIRLSCTPDGRSSGVFGPRIEERTYTFEINGRLDASDPAIVRAIWTYQPEAEPGKSDELDILEATRWSDPNNPSGIYLTTWIGGENVRANRFPARAFNRYRITLEARKVGTVVTIFGIFPGGAEHEIAKYDEPRLCVIGHELRVGIWIKGKEFVFKDPASYGNLRFNVRVS